jgi:hypothetical protein
MLNDSISSRNEILLANDIRGQSMMAQTSPEFERGGILRSSRQRVNFIMQASYQISLFLTEFAASFPGSGRLFCQKLVSGLHLR